MREKSIKSTIKIFLMSILLIGIVAFILIYYRPINRFLMKFEEVDLTYNAKVSLRTETWFERQFQEIQSQKASLKSTQEEMSNNKSESLLNSYYAQKKVLNSLIAEYNAKMESSQYKEFANRSLPRHIEFIEEVENK